MKLCTAEGCEKPSKPRSPRYCGMHWGRLYAYGNLDLPDRPRFPIEPLIAIVERRGGPRMCTGNLSVRRAYTRALEAASLEPIAADHLAVRLLGLHPYEVWGDDWWSTGFGPTIETLSA